MVEKVTVALPSNSNHTKTSSVKETSTRRDIKELVKMVKSRRARAPKPKSAAKPNARSVKNRVPKRVFGPISTIDTAPVSIGNSITGATPVVTPIEDGQRIQGRDFLLGIDPTASGIADWTLVAGSPISPACMIASTLKHFSSTYAHYMVHGVAFHFITSSSTATNGSIMFYVNKDRSRPALPTDSTNFMSAVLSDHNTTIGPLWKNTTASYFPEPVWFTTDIFDGEQMLSQCPGEVFMYTKSVNNEVPGYVLIDYDISFRGLALNPKTGVLPVARMKYTQVALTFPTTVVVAGTTPVIVLMNTGLLLDGVTTSTAPTGATLGDIYKVVIDEDDSSFTGTGFSASTAFLNLLGGGFTTPVSLTDGYTLYGVITAANSLTLCPNFAYAQSGGNALRFGVSTSVSFIIRGYLSLCGSVGGTLSQSSI